MNNDLITHTEELDYTISDSGITADDKPVVTMDVLKANDFFVEDGKILNSDNVEITIDKEWIDNLKPVEEGDTIEYDGVSYKLSETGDLLNADNTVFKTKTDYDAEIASTTIAIEDGEGNTVTLKLDDKGNALNDKGEVVYTKEELDSLNEQPNTSFTPTTIMEQTNIRILDENGQPVTYQDGEEGVLAYVKDVYNLGASNGNENAINEFVSSHTGLDKAVKYIMINGSLDGFNPAKTDYNSVKFDIENVAQLKGFILDAEIARGKSKEAAQKVVDYYEADKALGEGAKEAFAYLKEEENKLITAKQQASAEAEANNLKQSIDYWGMHVDDNGNVVVDNVKGSVYDKILNDKKLVIGESTYNLPDIIRRKTPDGKIVNAELNDYFDYLFRAVPVRNNDGSVEYYTQDQITRMIKENNTSKDEYLLESFMNFTGGDSTQFIKKQMDKAKVANVRKLRVDSFKDNINVNSDKNKPRGGDTSKGISKLPFEQ